MATRAVRTRKRAPSPTASQNDVATGCTASDNLRLPVTYVPPGNLKPPERQLRKHDKRQVQAIEASISEFGFLDPLLVDSANRIVCGHGRWLAASALKLALVPVIVIDHLTPEQLRLYAIAENRLGDLSEFDFSALKLEFNELEELNCDLNLELTGFSTGEVDDMVIGKTPEPGEDHEPLRDGPAVTAMGDLWLAGDHRLLCGNSLERESYDALMDGEKAGMIFGDPPYNLSSSAISGSGKHNHPDFAMAAGEMSREEFTTFIATYSKHLVAFSVDGSIHFQCMDWKHLAEMQGGGEQAYSELKNLIVWAKPSAGMGTFYRSQHELIFVWKAGTAPHVNNFGLGETGRYRSNVWTCKGNAGFHRDRDEELAAHPTVKPWSLVADAIRDCSKRKAIVLDPFGGYGTTIIAAERTGRKARLIEIDPHYCDASIRRWEKLTGKEAVLAPTGQTFAEVAEARGIDLEDETSCEPDDDDGEDA